MNPSLKVGRWMETPGLPWGSSLTKDFTVTVGEKKKKHTLRVSLREVGEGSESVLSCLAELISEQGRVVRRMEIDNIPPKGNAIAMKFGKEVVVIGNRGRHVIIRLFPDHPSGVVPAKETCKEPKIDKSLPTNKGTLFIEGFEDPEDPEDLEDLEDL